MDVFVCACVHTKDAINRKEKAKQQKELNKTFLVLFLCYPYTIGFEWHQNIDHIIYDINTRVKDVVDIVLTQVKIRPSLLCCPK